MNEKLYYAKCCSTCQHWDNSLEKCDKHDIKDCFEYFVCIDWLVANDVSEDRVLK